VSFVMFNYISLRFKFRVVKSATISTQQSCSVCLYSHVDSFVGSSSFIYLYLFMHTGVLHDFHSRRCSCYLTPFFNYNIYFILYYVMYPIRCDGTFWIIWHIILLVYFLRVFKTNEEKYDLC
jgi:hypothetical protein